MQPKFLNLIKLFGFSLLKNGVKYDYSFQESLLSMSPLVENIYLALDKGEDTTEQVVLNIPKVKIIESNWDMTLTRGLVLSVETNKALHLLKSEHSNSSDWGIYLQADEVLHQDDLDLIKNDIQLAEQDDCDAVSFRYLHFWQTHHHLAIAKNWYPQEIRAIKLKSPVESYGDAQSFKNFTKIYESEARIFHYGHVRDQSIYQKKMNDMSKLYNLDAKKSKYYNEKDRGKEYTDCLLFFGTHPSVMKDRILRMNDVWELPIVDEVYIVGNPKKYSQKMLSMIHAKNIHWVVLKSEIPKKEKITVVQTDFSILDKIIKRTNVPNKMKSKAARLWDNDFKLILLLSEKNIGLKNNREI